MVPTNDLRLSPCFRLDSMASILYLVIGTRIELEREAKTLGELVGSLFPVGEQGLVLQLVQVRGIDRGKSFDRILFRQLEKHRILRILARDCDQLQRGPRTR